MPDAISLVSKVLDDLGDAGDPMDVDSGSGPGTKQTLEDTLAACVKCLVQCFSPVVVQAVQAATKGEKEPPRNS
jgi:proteasome component ECM29